MISSISVLILFTIIFFYVIGINIQTTRTNESNNKNEDGNGKYQYKGRGDQNENIDVLLSRIDWLAKNSVNTSLYTISYITSYGIMLAVIFILYAHSKYFLSPWEIILTLFSSFIVCFSILNLFQFHTDRFPNYYIRKNIDYISKNFNIPIFDPPNPIEKEVHKRTEVQDVLTR